MRSLILLTLILTGCSLNKTPNPEPIFKFTQGVKVQRGFYEGVNGYVTNYHYCRDDKDQLTVCYNVTADFGLVQWPLDNAIYEADLVAVEKEEK